MDVGDTHLGILYSDAMRGLKDAFLCVTFISDHFSKLVSFFFAIVILTDFSFIHWTLHYFVHYLPSIIHCPHTPLSKLFNKILFFLLTHHARKYFCKDNTYICNLNNVSNKKKTLSRCWPKICLYFILSRMYFNFVSRSSKKIGNL